MMTEKKHSLGPWNILTTSNEIPIKGIYIENDEFIICQVANKKDAPLISAALDLLEALIETKRIILLYDPNFAGSPSLKNIEAAIAKATGSI